MTEKDVATPSTTEQYKRAPTREERMAKLISPIENADCLGGTWCQHCQMFHRPYAQDLTKYIDKMEEWQKQQKQLEDDN